MSRTNISHALLSPYYALGVFTRAKSFEGNPILGNRWLNDRGLHTYRVRLAHRVATMRRARLAPLLAVEDRHAFDRDGFIVRENFLPAPVFAALVAQTQAFRGAAWDIAQGSTINRKLALDTATLAAIPSLRAVLESPDWRTLIRYIGSRNGDASVYIQTIIRNANPGGADPQTMLHADTFHPTVKAWLFLTDVAEEGGPFAYVPGSHRLTPARLAWEHAMSVAASAADNRETREGSFRLASRDLARLGLPPPRLFAVPANTLVVADTFGFHARGPSPLPSRRVEIFAIGARSPFTPWCGLDGALSAGRLGKWRAALTGHGARRHQASAFDER